ncbi:MAG: lysozyme inhibitor LprI family protein [Chania sp.]
MYKKYLLATAIAALSFNANAGLFDSNDFKCGREDAVKAFSDFIKSDASGLLQSNFLTNGKAFYSKPLDVYQSKLNALEVNVANVSTLSTRSETLYCGATVSVKLPQEVIDVVGDIPSKLSEIKGYSGKLVNGSVVWSNAHYSIKLADNKKDILISDLDGINASSSMYNAVVMSADKDKIIDSNSQGKLSSVKYNYEDSDRELNRVWRDLPDSSRDALKKSQVAWVGEKAIKCGKLSDAKLDTVSVQQKINTYQCQKKMTDERINYLVGNSN